MKPLELICPAGTPASLHAAVDAGADAVYVGFRDETNARNFPGLNFTKDELGDGLDYAHSHNCNIYLAVNTYGKAGNIKTWLDAIDSAAELGVDALILADIGLLEYASSTYKDLRLHLSVQASASNAQAIEFYRMEFDVKRVVLPRVLSVKEIAELNKNVSTTVLEFHSADFR